MRVIFTFASCFAFAPVLAQQPPGAAPPPVATWVSGTARAANFPQSPVAAPPQQASAPFQNTNYGPANYSVNGQPAPSMNGVAPLQPLTPPPGVPGAFDQARAMLAPFTPGELQQLRTDLDEFRRASGGVQFPVISEIRTASVDLRPGASVPTVRTAPGEISTILFVDATGAPWPLAAPPRYGNSRLIGVDWLSGTNSLVVSAAGTYGQTNLTTFLAGLPTPVIVKVDVGQSQDAKTPRRVDARLDLRVPGRGPNAVAPVMVDDQIAVYDETLQAFLDGVPPADAESLVITGDTPSRTQAWTYRGDLYVRTSLDTRSAFVQSMAAADGTRIYRLTPTPFVALSDGGVLLNIRVELP